FLAVEVGGVGGHGIKAPVDKHAEPGLAPPGGARFELRWGLVRRLRRKARREKNERPNCTRKHSANHEVPPPNAAREPNRTITRMNRISRFRGGVKGKNRATVLVEPEINLSAMQESKEFFVGEAGLA